MFNSQKYTSLMDYSIKLSKSMENFDNVFFATPPKQMGSFRVTMNNINKILDNLQEIDEIQEEMEKLTTMDLEAKKENKSARKAAEQIRSIKSELNQSCTRLKDEFFKQMDIAEKQCKEVEKKIQDKETRERFKETSVDFNLMVYESATNKSIIPINKKKKDDLSQYQYQMWNEHNKQEREINDTTSFELEDSNKLENALDVLTSILAKTPIDDISKEVRKEVAQINKVLPPKTIAIAKDNLERLRHSSHLLLDLEQISEIMKTPYCFSGSDGKLRKIEKRLRDLQPLLKQAIIEERKRNTNIEHEYNDIKNKVNYATDAVRTYSNILNENSKLKKEQDQIRDRTHRLYDENENIKKDEQKAISEAHEIQSKSLEMYNFKVDELYERASNDREKVINNITYMTDKIVEKSVTALPVEYTDMKNRLKSVSPLYQIEMTDSQQLLTGGMTR